MPSFNSLTAKPERRKPGTSSSARPAKSVLSRSGILATGALLAAMAMPATAQESAAPRITVTGEGAVSIAPDMAVIDLGVTREAPSARQALTDNNEAMAQVIDAMKAAGIADRDLQTSNFSIQPRYQHHRPQNGEDQKPPQIIGYLVSNRLTVRIRDMAKIGEILDQSVTLGVNDGGAISFTNDAPGGEITKARAAAVEDALQRARTLAEAAGVNLGPILEINENSAPQRPVPLREARMMAADASSAVPIEGGENTYRVTVTVTWQIAQ